jgi:hypothetical protein
MLTEETIKALANKTLLEIEAKRFILNREDVIFAMCEIYKAALSSTERVECYLPCSKEEGNFYIENVGWAKEVTLTVVPNHQ